MEPLNKEDYAEPRCVLCDEPYGAEPGVKSIPQRRIIEKMNDYMSRRDYAGAERHLLYWLEEARLGRDLRGELLVRNELIGHFRKTGNAPKAFEQIDLALKLIEAMDYDGTISSGTTYTNAATACNAFGENERALELFRKAQAVYEASPNTAADLLGGLYNNMALTLVSLKRFPEAHALYDRAMALMETVPNGVLEMAITCLNRANAIEDEVGLEDGESRICGLLDRAEELLDTPSVPRDGYYAFVLEKCAPTFSYYGYFLAAQRFEETAAAIYKGNTE
ncbi:MAG: tetratricopeptide repeat protein [Lachnospiraceae bacterium]|nr:tetratricopeptide repeat protein [Lachnospiraceae bacterium]